MHHPWSSIGRLRRLNIRGVLLRLGGQGALHSQVCFPATNIAVISAQSVLFNLVGLLKKLDCPSVIPA